jgi:alkyl sulfatase BDS1-like metallo-beta-lactamase superfamily hydrolase
VLAGARWVLSHLKPGLLFIECEGHEPPSLLAESLEQLGYEVEVHSNATHLHPHLIARQRRT